MSKQKSYTRKLLLIAAWTMDWKTARVKHEEKLNRLRVRQQPVKLKGLFRIIVILSIHGEDCSWSPDIHASFITQKQIKIWWVYGCLVEDEHFLDSLVARVVMESTSRGLTSKQAFSIPLLPPCRLEYSVMEGGEGTHLHSEEEV